MNRPAGRSIEFALQLAALAWRSGPDGLELLLVTSRISRRWLIPKGWPISGKSDAESALQEAYEEAGVLAQASKAPVGEYRYIKLLKDGTSVPCTVHVYALSVDEQLADWPERNQRDRRWFKPEEAAAAVTEPDLARFLTDVAEGKVTVG